jgi:peptide/nickel transport system substrate-binding protein
MLVLYESPDVTLLNGRPHGMTTWPLRIKRFFNVTKN